MNYAEPIEQTFRDNLNSRKKKGMLKRFFHYDKSLNFLEIPLFTEFTGRKQIKPFRNAQCLKGQCIFDLEELVQKYRKSAFSSYLQFICPTCRKMIDIQNFYLDQDLEEMINSIWEKYNKFTIQCSKVAVFKDGTWEPVLPEYLKRLYKKVYDEKNIPKLDDEIDAEPNEIIRYDDFPMLEQFNIEEYVSLLKDETDDEEYPHHDQDVLLRRYDLLLKWGEFLHVRNQTAFLQNPMGIYIKYLEEYLEKSKKSLGMKSNYKTAFLTLKVTNFDRFNKKAQFFFISDNLQGPKANFGEYDMAIIALNYDERWIAFVISLDEKKIKQIDFLEDTISRVTQDEIQELIIYLMEQIFQPYKFPKIQSLDQLCQQIQEQQRIEIPRKIQQYNDCGHHVAQYFYYYIQEEIELIKQQKQWPQEVQLPSKMHNVKYKLGERDYFTFKVCWVFLKMSKDEGTKIKVYDYKPQLEIIREDALDSFIIDHEQQKAEKIWDLQDQKPQPIQKKNTIQISKKLNDIQEYSKKLSNPSRQKVERYWGANLGQQTQFNLEQNDLTNKSLQMVTENLKSNINYNNNNNNNNNNNKQQYRQSNINTDRYPNSQKNDQGQFNNLSDIQNQSYDKSHLSNSNQQQSSSNATIQQLINSNQNNLKNKKRQITNPADPFLVMPKVELQQYLADQKQDIIKQYKQQGIVKGYFNQKLIQNALDNPKSNQSNNIDNQLQKLQMTDSQYERLLLNLDRKGPQDEDNQIKELQLQLGLTDEELANLDGYQFNQMMDMVELMDKDKYKKKKRRRPSNSSSISGQYKSNINIDQ